MQEPSTQFLSNQCHFDALSGCNIIFATQDLHTIECTVEQSNTAVITEWNWNETVNVVILLLKSLTTFVIAVG